MTDSPRPLRMALIPVAISAFTVLTCIGVCVGYPCFSTGFKYGIWLDTCPATDLRLQAIVEASGLVRGADGYVNVHPTAMWLQGKGASAYGQSQTFSRGARVALELRDLEDQPVSGMEVAGFKVSGSYLQSKVKLPDVPDGDYKLHAVVTTGFEIREIDVDLPLYAPAIVHIMSDRPLYKPGQEVLLRSAILKRTDLTPLDGRPGTWRIFSPSGLEMLVERDKAGSFGVADSSFPLDKRAEIGTWTAVYASGNATDQVQFQVKPFKLPRFSVELKPDADWYGISDEIGLDGVARYTSGAPVANAAVTVNVRKAEGRWPAPLDWEEAIEVKTGPDGKFELDLGVVPPDLIELATFSVSARVTEQAGEVVSGGAKIILSKDDLKIEAVTELGGGLVQGFNNRAYVRVMTPDGVPVRLADLTVTNPWDEMAKAREAKTDEDGVAAIQLDPGDPVTVVIPAVPARVRPLTPADPSVNNASELVGQRSLSMGERRALDELYPAIAQCGDLAVGAKAVQVGLEVGSAGDIRAIDFPNGHVAACVGAAMRRVRFGPGVPRVYSITWQVPDSLRPSLNTSTSVASGGDAGVHAALQRAAIDARPCMPRGTGINGVRALDVGWQLTPGSTSLVHFVTVHSGTGLSPSAMACVNRSVLSARLDEPAKAAGIGSARMSLSVPQAPGTTTPQAGTRTGYELKVTAVADAEDLGSTRAIFDVGTIPRMRLRATPSLAKPGDTVKVEMFRGPDFYGEFPKKLALMEGSRQVDRQDVTDNSVSFTIPEDVDGFLHVDFDGARAVVFVQPKAPLAVTLSTDKKAYRPGDEAMLTVTTTAGGQPAPAGVGLVGVDSALAQLAPLMGPDDYGRVTVRATSDNPAFGSFDPRALTLGQVRGENAAKAAVLRISQLPMDSAGDVALYANASVSPDVVGDLTTHFYGALERLVVKVRAWEESAPKEETMQPATMVSLWDAVLADMSNEDNPAIDAYGRPLKLNVLPADLLEQVDPRQVVADGTRLPEDVVSWPRYVAEEVK